MKRILVILPALILLLFIACGKSSSDGDTGYSVSQGISNPYAAVTQSDFNIKYGAVTYIQSPSEKHYAIAYSNGTSAGVACAAYAASGKELFKLTFSVPSTSALPSTTGSSVNYSSAAGSVIVRYTPDGSGNPSTTHSSNALKMARNDSATVDFTITKTGAGYSVVVNSISNPDATNSLIINNSSTFTAVVAE